MNKYIIPVCNIPDSEVYNLVINARSYSECEDRIMEKFSEYSTNIDYHEFLKELDKQDVLIGEITDIEELWD